MPIDGRVPGVDHGRMTAARGTRGREPEPVTDGGSIVCAVDASREARTAAHVAAVLAARAGCRLVLVHAVPSAVTVHAEAWPHARESVAQQGAETLARVASTAGVEAAADLLVEHGDPADAVIRVVADRQAALVVTGTRGAGPLSAAVLGSVSARLVDEAPCPVLVVPPVAVAGPDLVGDRVIVAIGSIDDVACAAVAVGLARALDVTLCAAHVLDAEPVDDAGAAVPLDYGVRLERAERAGVRLVHRVLDRYGPLADTPTEVRLRKGDVGHELLRLAEAERAALIVCGSRGRGSLKATLLGSTSRQLLRHARVPVAICSLPATVG